MKKRFIIILIVVALIFSASGCMKPNEAEVSKALEIVSKVSIPDRYSQYDGVKLIPQDIEVEVTPYSRITGEQHYRFSRQYHHPKWYLRTFTNCEAEVMLVVEGYSYIVTKTPQQVYEQVDYTKTHYSIDFLEQEAENLSWQ